MVNASAPGNIFLLGEHAVVYGKPGIVSAIGLKTHCEIEKRPDSVVSISSENYGKFIGKADDLVPLEKYKERIDLIKDLVSTFYHKFKIKDGINLKISSDLPRIRWNELFNSSSLRGS